MQKKKNTLELIKKNKLSYFMAAPYFILFFIFTVLPVCVSIFLSFTSYNMFQNPVFLGIENYRRMFVKDDVFMTAIKNTLVFAVITGPLGYIICFGMAWIINDFRPGFRAVLTTIFYAPSISGAVYMVWQIMFSADSYGYINSILMRLGIIRAPIFWIEDPSKVLWVCIIVQLWLSLGTGFLSFIAGFQGIDQSMYEAAAVDGIRNRFQELWFITLPAMKPQLLFASVMQITAALGVGDLTANMAGMPSVDYAAHTIANHITDFGNTRFEMGYASAIATKLFIFMVGSNKFVQKLNKKVGN